MSSLCSALSTNRRHLLRCDILLLFLKDLLRSDAIYGVSDSVLLRANVQSEFDALLEIYWKSTKQNCNKLVKTPNSTNLK